MQLTIVLGLLLAGSVVFSGRVAQAQDSSAPEIVTTASLDGRKVGIRFNEALDPNSAANPANYRLSGGAVVNKATLRPDGISVELVVSGLSGPDYTLTVMGVQDLSHNAATRSASGVVEGLIPEDIGQPAQTGSTFSCAPGSVEVKAGGVDIWDNADSFHFTHQERKGDFDIRVRVVSFGPEGAHVYAKAALMMRESLDRGSRHVSVSVYRAMGTWTARFRAATNGPTAMLRGDWRINWPAGTAFPNAWLRLKRAGGTITSYGSVNGEEWTQIGDVCIPEVPFPDTVLVGLGTTSHGEQEPAYSMVDVRYEQFGDFIITNAVVTFLQHPTSAAVSENHPVTFAAAAQVTGTPAVNLSYQWLKNNVAMPGATEPAYSTPPVTLADNGARYRLRVSLPGGYHVLSKEAMLTVQRDVAPPIVSSVAALIGGPIGVRFSELLQPENASNPAHYSIGGGGSVTGAELMADGRTVVLHVTGLQAGPHQLTVTGVADRAGNPANTNLPITQLDWTAEDIGAVADPGLAYACDAAEINVRAAGGNIWTNADSFHFVRCARTGDFDVVVQMAHLSRVNDYTRGGLMVREDLTPGSRNFFACTYPGSGLKRWASTVRFVTGGATTLAPGDSYVLRPSGFAYPNVWFRLKRVANTFTAYCGTNGVDWVQLGDQLAPVPPYPATVYLGLATTPNSSAPGQAATAQYLHFADGITSMATEPNSRRPEQPIVTPRPATATGLILKTADELTAATWTASTEGPMLSDRPYAANSPPGQRKISIGLTNNPGNAVKRLAARPAISGYRIP